jgi:hypothetical protein
MEAVMGSRRLVLAIAFAAALAPQLLAGIDRIDLRVEGMT